jgi:hypothetical protein
MLRPQATDIAGLFSGDAPLTHNGAHNGAGHKGGAPGKPAEG